MLDSQSGISKTCHSANGRDWPYRFMCVQPAKCKAKNAFYCQKCSHNHINHNSQDLQEASQFCKKLRRLGQFQELLTTFQRGLQQQLSRTSKILEAGTAARKRVFKAAGTIQQENYSSDPTDIMEVFITKDFDNGLSVPICSQFQNFVLSVNYKDLSSSISTLKKSVEKMKSGGYLDEIMLKIFAFQSGSTELFKKLDFSVVADKVVENRLNQIKRKMSCLEQNLKTPMQSQITRPTSTSNSVMNPQTSSIFSQIFQQITNLASANKRKRMTKQTQQFQTGEQTDLADKIVPRQISNRVSLVIHPSTSPPTADIVEKAHTSMLNRRSSKFSLNQPNINKTVQNIVPIKSTSSLMGGGTSEKTFSRSKTKMKLNSGSVTGCVEDRVKQLKEFQQAKGNFGEMFQSTRGNIELRWEVLKSIEIYATTKILRLNHNELTDITRLAQVNLKNLKYLHLNNNKISDLSQFLDIDLKTIQVLTLDNNLIQDLSSLCGVNLKALQVLSINNNLIESLQGLVCVNFYTLQGLALSGNRIEDPLPLKSLDYKGMFWIQLKNNKFSKDDIEWVKKLTVKNKAGSKICIYV